MKISLEQGAVLVENATPEQLYTVEQRVDLLFVGQDIRTEVAGLVWLLSDNPGEESFQVDLGEQNRLSCYGRLIGPLPGDPRKQCGIQEMLLKWHGQMFRACPVPIGGPEYNTMRTWTWYKVWFIPQEQEKEEL